MKEFQKMIRLLAIAAVSVFAVGCGSSGPDPMSETDVKAALDKATPEQQIDWINRSPMPPAEKKQKIEEIEKKYGIKGGQVATAPGAPVIPGNGK